MNKIRKLATFLITSILLSSCARSDTGKGYREISMDEAAIMMEEETNYIIQKHQLQAIRRAARAGADAYDLYHRSRILSRATPG